MVVRCKNLSHITAAAEIGAEEECALFAAKENSLVPSVLMTVTDERTGIIAEA